MPIKSLELVGYKTFASKTSFNFSDRITAIVGPNGSGKSNIADALRWVLGEQSYSLLRGRKTVDMIFSGSDTRARAGMASATVVFENSDGWLPIDFSEVAVTRRAYRDGQNEYLINGQKVRLRDISELLGRAGLAERTYTIIGQGLVDAALSLKAEERRKLFEEAAGIGIYRVRREEALKRLDATRRNLERVQDILTELEPRLRSLERQARRAREYEQLKLDLHVLLREWYGYHWHQRQNALKVALDNARLREDELDKARGRQQDFDQEIGTLRKQIHEQRERLSEWQRETAQLHSRRERVSRDLAVAGQRKIGLEDRQAAAKTGFVRAQEEQHLLEERLGRAERELERLKEEAAQAQEQFDAVQRDLEEQANATQEVQDTMDDLNRRKAEYATRTVQEKARLEEISERLDSLQKESQEGSARLEALEEQARAARQRAAELDSRQEALQNEAQVTRARLQDLGTREAQLSAGERDLAERISQEKTEKARLAARFEVLEQAEQALSGYSQGAQVLMKAAHDGQVTGLGHVLGLQIEAEAAYEAAVAAGLGVFLDAVVLKAGNDLLPLLMILEEESANGSILPLAFFEQTPQPASPVIAGSLGRAVDFVKAPDELQPVLEALLGDAIIVPDRETAMSLLDGHRADFSGRVITQAGEIFRAAGGVVVTGATASGLIARPRQKRETEEALTEVADRIRVLEGEQADISSQLAHCRSELALVEGKRGEERELSDQIRAESQSVVAEVEQLESQKSWQRASMERTAAEVERAEEIIQHSRQLVDEYNANEAQLQEQIHSLQADLHAHEIEELESQAALWKTRLAVGERAVADARLRVEERGQALTGVGERLAALEGNLSAGEEESRELDEEVERLQSEEAEIGAQLDDLMKIFGPAETRLGELERQQDNRLGIEIEARQALSVAERYHAQAQIQLARRQEALDSLRQRIEDDFGVVAFEYLDEVPGQTALPMEDIVEALPMVLELSLGLDESIKRQRAQLRRIGAINPEAQQEYEEVQTRHSFLTGQVEDLEQAEKDILEVVNELDLIMEREFRKTFEDVAREFRDTFTRLFGGGSARLVLTDPDDLTISGVDIEARLPGRRAQGLSLLSGGERSLTATALVFSLIKVSPTPFCVLDEVDAMLDEANVNRFADLLRELSRKTQFIIITHNRNTVQSAETIYGITMGSDSTSQVLGLKLDEVATVV